VTFLLADGVRPGNEGRGYVLRRIIRRAVRHGRLLGIERSFLPEVARVVIRIMSEAYPYLRESETVVVESLEREEAQFARTLGPPCRCVGATRKGGERGWDARRSTP
jgi:alanyl-tRNA synthetase